MKFTDREERFDAYYEFGGERFANIERGIDGWDLRVKEHFALSLGLEELMALHTLVAKAIVIEKQKGVHDAD